MAEPVFYGICLNCIHARTCRYALNAAKPVHFCDMHEVNGNPVVEAGGVRWAGRFRGLCVDCEKRHQCDKARTESGVWHCKDYQSRIGVNR
jgi:hypothetical protein